MMQFKSQPRWAAHPPKDWVSSLDAGNPCVCARLCLILIFASTLVSGIPGSAQNLPQAAMATFPADTQQIAYVNLSDLRRLPDYNEIRQMFLTQDMQSFEDFLRSLTNDPEKDIDEVMLGWRGSAGASSSFLFGLVSGTFDRPTGSSHLKKGKLSSIPYWGFSLDTFDSDHSQFYFTSLNSHTVAFGRIKDLKALLDVRLGNSMALSTNSDFVNWEAELEDASSEWGITTGNAAANFAAPLLMGGARSAINLTPLLSSVRAVLYKVEWSGNLTVTIGAICKDGTDAVALANILKLFRDSHVSSVVGVSSHVSDFIQGLEIDQEGSRVDIQGAAPPNLLGLIQPPQPGSPWKPPSGVKANAHQ